MLLFLYLGLGGITPFLFLQHKTVKDEWPQVGRSTDPKSKSGESQSTKMVRSYAPKARFYRYSVCPLDSSVCRNDTVKLFLLHIQTCLSHDKCLFVYCSGYLFTSDTFDVLGLSQKPKRIPKDSNLI